MDDLDAVRAANQRYYDAFEAADLDAMSAAWEHGDRVVCTHPGWPALRGWAKVAASYMALFQRPPSLQFVLTEARPVVIGEAAWVSLDENLLGDQGGVTVSVLNLFALDGGRWSMVAHHGSVVQAALGSMG